PIDGVSKLRKNLYLCGGSAASVEIMRQLVIILVINVATESELDDTPLPAKDTRYVRIPVKDNREENLERYFHEVADMIEEECKAMVKLLWILCLAYLMKYHRVSLKHAYNHIKDKPPQIRPNVSFVKQFIKFEQKLYEVLVASKGSSAEDSITLSPSNPIVSHSGSSKHWLTTNTLYLDKLDDGITTPSLRSVKKTLLEFLGVLILPTSARPACATDIECHILN
ncbi:dual specificity protein phosphatase 18-like, partial [Anopheles nili]|uniref:dual specificity protein phosphatase 18-like n=1 Tax=Anopheles nili TaxID=185578 RepID=UPI00237C2328